MSFGKHLGFGKQLREIRSTVVGSNHQERQQKLELLQRQQAEIEQLVAQLAANPGKLLQACLQRANEGLASLLIELPAHLQNSSELIRHSVIRREFPAIEQLAAITGCTIRVTNAAIKITWGRAGGRKIDNSYAPTKFTQDLLAVYAVKYQDKLEQINREGAARVEQFFANFLNQNLSRIQAGCLEIAKDPKKQQIFALELPQDLMTDVYRGGFDRNFSELPSINQAEASLGLSMGIRKDGSKFPPKHYITFTW